MHFRMELAENLIKFEKPITSKRMRGRSGTIVPIHVMPPVVRGKK